MTWLVVAVGLLLLVFLHELGHFGVALMVGMRPRSFYVGFPPALAKIKRNGIEYGIGAIPLGGLVRLPGMHKPAARDLQAFLGPALRENAALSTPTQRARRALENEDFDGAREALPELRAALDQARLSPSARRSAERALRDVDDGTAPDAYWRQSIWKRVAVTAAGPLMNVLVAFVIFTIVYATGATTGNWSTKVNAVESKTPAASAGLRAGDRVVAVDGKPAPTFDRMHALIAASRGRQIVVTVERDGARVKLPPRAPERVQGRWIFGFLPAREVVSYSVGSSVSRALGLCGRVVTGTFDAFGGLVHSNNRAQLTTVVGIAEVSNQALRTRFNDYLEVVGFVSMSLALLNLLPFLPLDGGHILFSLLEGVRRRAIARELYERVSVIGFSLLILIFFIALNNDVGRYFHG